MADFTWSPSRGFTSDIVPKVNVAKFGDGYSQRVPSGLNNIEKTWNLTFQSRPLTTIANIEAFLVSKKGSIPFTWLPTGESTEVWVVAPKWSKTYETNISATLSVTFEIVYGYG